MKVFMRRFFCRVDLHGGSDPVVARFGRGGYTQKEVAGSKMGCPRDEGLFPALGHGFFCLAGEIERWPFFPGGVSFLNDILG